MQLKVLLLVKLVAIVGNYPSVELLEHLKELRAEIRQLIEQAQPVQSQMTQLACKCHHDSFVWSSVNNCVIIAKLTDAVKSSEDWQAFQLAMHTYNQSKRGPAEIKTALEKLDDKWDTIESRFMKRRNSAISFAVCFLFSSHRFVGAVDLPLRVLSPSDRLKPAHPTTERVCRDVMEPAARPLKRDEVFPPSMNGLPDHEALRKHLLPRVD